MTMDLGRVGFESEPRRIAWSPADCSLYALTLGAGFDEVAFVTENAIGHPQRVFPTFVLAGVMARESASWTHPGFHTGDYEVHQIVLGQVRLELLGPVEPSGDVLVRTRVDGIYDKGRSALVELAVRAGSYASYSEFRRRSLEGARTDPVQSMGSDSQTLLAVHIGEARHRLGP